MWSGNHKSGIRGTRTATFCERTLRMVVVFVWFLDGLHGSRAHHPYVTWNGMDSRNLHWRTKKKRSKPNQDSTNYDEIVCKWNQSHIQSTSIILKSIQRRKVLVERKWPFQQHSFYVFCLMTHVIMPTDLVQRWGPLWFWHLLQKEDKEKTMECCVHRWKKKWCNHYPPFILSSKNPSVFSSYLTSYWPRLSSFH